MIMNEWMISGVSFVSLVVAAIATKFSTTISNKTNDSTNSNETNYQRKIEKESSLQPIFVLHEVAKYGDQIKFSLTNINSNPLSIISLEHQESQDNFLFKLGTQQIECVLSRELNDQEDLSLTIEYSLADGRNFKKKLNIREYVYGLYISKQVQQRIAK